MPKSPEPRTSATVAAEIAAQAGARRAATAELDRLTDVRPAMLLDLTAKGDAALDAHDIAITRQRRAIERSDAVVAVLEIEMAQLQADEDQAARVDLYSAGQVAASEVADLVLNDYPAAARGVVDVLLRIAEAGAAVAHANANLPAGAVPLKPESFRNDRAWTADLPALAAGVALPAPRASEGSIWPMVSRSAPYDAAAERVRRDQERDRRNEQANAERAQEQVAPKVERKVMSADEFGQPTVTVTQPDMEAWHRERDARDRAEQQPPKPRARSWAGI